VKNRMGGEKSKWKSGTENRRGYYCMTDIEMRNYRGRGRGNFRMGTERTRGQ